MNREQAGILFLLISCLCFSLMGAVVKILGGRLGGVELVFFRNIFGVLLIGGSILWHFPRQSGGRFFTLIMRGIFGSTSLLAYFYNITQIPLATAFTLTQTTPLFIALITALWLKEKVEGRVWVAIFLGLSGVGLLYPPTLEGFSLGVALLGIYSGLGAALAYLSIAELKTHYDQRVIMLSLMLSGTILPVIWLTLEEWSGGAGWVMPQGGEWLWILALGITSTLGQVFVTKAYASAKPSMLGAVSYSTILLALLWGVWLGDELPTGLGVAGMGLIVLGGWLSARGRASGARERR